MTLFGPDVSKWQEGLAVGPGDLAVTSFAMCRASIGERIDPAHSVVWPQMAPLGYAYAAYHFVYQTSRHPADAQADTFDRAVDGNIDVAVMLDVEHDGDERPDWGDTVAVADAIRARGYRVTLVYLPRWYWGSIGSPTLAGHGLDVVASDYGPNRAGGIVDVYAERGGDAGPGWEPYGELEPVLWQYGSRLEYGNKQVDMNAYRGDPADLGRWFTTAAGPIREDDDMALWAGVDPAGSVWVGDGVVRRRLPPDRAAWNVIVLRSANGSGPRVHLAGAGGGTVTKPDDVNAVVLRDDDGSLESLGADR